MNCNIRITLVTMVLLWSTQLLAAETEQELVETSSLRAAILDKGYSCSEVKAVERSKEYGDGRTPWLVTCPEARYKVDLVEDGTSQVQLAK